jgi:serine/threonine protein phosphatase PrpC
MKLKFVSRIDQGKVRTNQQDCILEVNLLDTPRKSEVFALADGMGGLARGEVASKEATQQVKAIFGKRCEEKTIRKLISKSVRTANQAVYQINKKGVRGEEMGTTLTCVEFFSTHLEYAHVGDSRLYRLRKKKLLQLTTDHALDRHTLTQAVGLEKTLKIDSRRLVLKKDDLYLLCSDGLYGMLDRSKLESLLIEDQSLESKADFLLTAALEAGGKDNISFFMIQVE